MYEAYEKLRKQKGVTDYRVSEETGIVKSTFSDWKSGRSKPKIEKLMILARYFDVPLEYFVSKRK
ncbi:MAG: helix-turn-helix transcriptional regulator [Eubacteriales bacterium]|nr:helix-turn-helix transcriptional regulator [Eubacteriales bacterium]